MIVHPLPDHDNVTIRQLLPFRRTFRLYIIQCLGRDINARNRGENYNNS
jgi:hypothetical protein